MASRSASGTESMAPGSVCCISLPRSATSIRASSREKTPAIQAAAYSPTLWPSRAEGVRPHSIRTLASEYSSPKSTGCVSDVSSIAQPFSSVPIKSMPVWVLSKVAVRCNSSRTRGSAAMSATPIDGD